MLIRRVFTAIKASKRPTTAREIAEGLGLEIGQVRNQCSRLLAARAAESVPANDGVDRVAYRAIADILPSDEKEIGELVEAYGARAVRAAVKRSEP